MACLYISYHGMLHSTHCEVVEYIMQSLKYVFLVAASVQFHTLKT